MGKRKFLRWLEAALFCALMLFAAGAVTKLVERKASVEHLTPFIERAGEYDVLFVGDSLMVNGVFPMEMWTDYGVAGYNLASYGNTIPVTYWTMMNALDYARPKVIVIGIKDVEKKYKLSGSSSDLHTAFDGYPLSITKIRALHDLIDDPDAVDDAGVKYVDMKWEYLFTLGKYHARWSDLGRSDFKPSYNVQKGGRMMIGVEEAEDYFIIDEYEAAEAYGCGFEYLGMMIEECQRRDIGVVLTHLPYPASENAQRNANAVIGIAEEYDVPYIDFVNLDQVVDYGTDCFDPRSHLNVSGGKKVSDYLGRFLADNFDLPDRRQDPAYRHWQDDHDAYIDHKIAFVSGENKLENILVQLHDADLSAVIALEHPERLYDNDRLYLLLQNVAREHVFEEDAFAKWSNALFPLLALDDAMAYGEPYFMMADSREDCIAEHAGSEDAVLDTAFGRFACQMREGKKELLRDGVPVFSGEKEMQILAIDNRQGDIVASFDFDL